MSEVEILEPKKRRINPIWFLPIIAAVLGIWMVIFTYLNEGPQIRITFSTAEGMEAGKTKIKALSVEVGIVEEIVLDEDLENVIVTARLDKSAARLLTEDAQFWVVRARIGAGGISGLGTILSGGYIELSPGAGAPGRRDYEGLDIQPVTPAGTPGLRLTLTSDMAGSVSAGDPVLFHGYKVGQIDSGKLNLESQRMTYEVFIEDPYKTLVTEGVRFWNASGLDISTSAAGIDVRMGSLTTLITGGVAFDVPDGFDPGSPIADGATFELHRNQSSISERPYQHYRHYVVNFDQSVRGLNRGAPVEYRGIRVGTVERIMVEDVVQKRMGGKGSPLPVLIKLEPGRFGLGDTAAAVERLSATVEEGVKQGMRASLSLGNLLTGALYVNIDYYDNQAPERVGETFDYPTIPTISGGLQRIEQRVSELLEKINDLPLETTVAELNATLEEAAGALEAVRKLAASEGMQQLPDRLDAALRDLSRTLEGVSAESELYVELGRAIDELNRTLRSVQGVTNTLEDKPSSLIFSSPQGPDPEPRAAP